MERYENDTVD
jgi:carbamoyl-phosphate synthase small subunit